MIKGIDTYSDIFDDLNKCFKLAFGEKETKDESRLISMNKVKQIVINRKKTDRRHNLPNNQLIEIPERDSELFDKLEETYIGREPFIENECIGCNDDPVEQMDGITNMSLLMYLSNNLTKEIAKKETSNNTLIKKLYSIKEIATTDLIASLFVLSKTSEEYRNYFSYGHREDDEGKSTFAIDLPYIGQICVHFGWDEKRDRMIERAKQTAKSIINNKLEKGQITSKQQEEIFKELESDGVLPEYDGRLYEYVGAMPIEYTGEQIKACRRKIGMDKVPENITDEDIKKLKVYGLNERELYYFFIKMGADKSLLHKVIEKKERISPQAIRRVTEKRITISDFNAATQDLRNLAKVKDIEKGKNSIIDVDL